MVMTLKHRWTTNCRVCIWITNGSVGSIQGDESLQAPIDLDPEDSCCDTVFCRSRGLREQVRVLNTELPEQQYRLNCMHKNCSSSRKHRNLYNACCGFTTNNRHKYTMRKFLNKKKRQLWKGSIKNRTLKSIWKSFCVVAVVFLVVKEINIIFPLLLTATKLMYLTRRKKSNNLNHKVIATK